MKKASGFYADSLEMLLDTMCNVLGGIVFITLTLAQLVRHSPASNPEYEQREAARLTNELAAVTAANVVVQAQLEEVALELQKNRNARTNLMSLPHASQTDRKPWPVIVRYGQLYPLATLAPGISGHIRNTSTLTWRRQSPEPKSGQGEDPERGIIRMVEAFRQNARTNYYFVFWAYDDSFPEFNRAKETVVKLAYQYGWEPLPAKMKLEVDSGGGERIPAQN
jgi:hypothetical protein